MEIGEYLNMAENEALSNGWTTTENILADIALMLKSIEEQLKKSKGN